MTIETNQLLKDTLKKNRPDLSESSIKTYLSNYNNISKGIKIVLVTQFDFVKYKDDILKYLDTLSLTQRKSKIAGIISLLSDKAEDKDYKDVIEEMRTVMNDAAREYDEKEVSQNSMSERQKLNYLSWPEIMAIYEKLKAHALPLLKIPTDKITNDVFEILQNYVLLSVYCLIPPRRVKDFALFKIRNIDTSEGSKDNYMTIEKKKPFFVFNTYKNAGRLGAQKVPITTELKKIIEAWIKINPTDWLIVSNKRTKIQLNRINTMLNNIFKRNLAPTLMRHAYLTHHFGNVNLADLEKTADQMGNSSITRILKYVDKEKAKEEGETKEV
jgi:integrase